MYGINETSQKQMWNCSSDKYFKKNYISESIKEGSLTNSGDLCFELVMTEIGSEGSIKLSEYRMGR